jgi:hypothetical protein
MAFHPDLRCDVSALSYSFETRQGILIIEDDGDVPDMAAVVALFAKLDPDVSEIRAVALATKAGEIRALGSWKVSAVFPTQDARRLH